MIGATEAVGGDPTDDLAASPLAVPLSAAEEQLWYFSQLAPESRAYNEAVVLIKSGPFDVDAFRAAFIEIIRRHETWRSTFVVVDGEPTRMVHRDHLVELSLLDLTAMPRDEAERRAAGIAAEEARRPYQLDRGPLIRPRLIRVANDDNRLYLSMHHIAFDGATLRIVVSELIALYEGLATSHPAMIQERPTQYSEYAKWEREWMSGPEFGSRIEYWHRRLAGAPIQQLPADRPRPQHSTSPGAIEPLHISGDVATGLRALSRRSNATLFQAVAAAFATLLHLYSGEDDVVFGTIADLRHRPEFESMVGYCVTPLVVRLDLGGNPTFIDLLTRTRAELLNGLANLVPFERLVRELHPQREPGASPIFRAMLAMQPSALPPHTPWDVHALEHDLPEWVDEAKFDLSVELDERPEGHIDGRLIYNTDIFEAATARRVAGHLRKLLESAVDDPSCPITQLSYMSADEVQQIVAWNATESAWPRDSCVHELFSAQALRTPDSAAVTCGSDRLTYAELDQQSNALAVRLRAAGAGPARVVAIAVERSLAMVVGLLAILKAGSAYVPLDPRHPRDRLSFILTESRAAVLLTQSDLLDSLPHDGLVSVCTDEMTSRAAEDSASPGSSKPDAVAYILYTSGSTGRPKGVRVLHRNVVNLMSALTKKPGLAVHDVVLAVATYTFDMSVADVFATLGVGAHLILASRHDLRDPRGLATLIDSAGATIMHATPATWQMLIDAGWKGRENLVAVSGGDTLPETLASALLVRCAEVWNGYGPTETTVYATFSRVTSRALISIGHPISNVRAYIVDHGLRPVPVGVQGELLIGGAGVADGYVNRDDETAERFVPDLFVAGERMYRTGDLARFRPDGSVVHLGRLDRQVKLRGVRIEPGEIEATLVGHPAVSSSVVTVRDDPDGDRRLVAHFVAEDPAPSDSDLRQWLQGSLPRYMVPAAFVRLERFPTTASGKLDRDALPAPDNRDIRRELVTLHTELEERIARIWARLLAINHVGVDEDFFDLGGHSLLAVRLVATVESELGVNLPIADFIEGGATVGRQAAFIEAMRLQAVPRQLIVRAQPHGTMPALFFMLPTPRAMFVRHYVSSLGDDQPVLGVVGPEQIGSPPGYAGNLAELAMQRVRAIRSEQPSGPYFLAGYSLGGLLAYEVAGQLRAEGQQVAWVCLLNTATPEALARFWKRRYLRIGQVALRVSPLTAWRTVRDQVRATRVFEGLRRPRVVDGFDPHAAIQLSLNYRCVGHDAPLEVFATADEAATIRSASLGWGQVHQGPLTVHAVPGDHRSLVRASKEVRLVAEMVAMSLRAAQASI